MRIGGLFFGNHQRRDAGTFQIYHKGPLAMSSGHYGSDCTSHWGNCKRRILSICRAVLLNLESMAMKSDYHSSISVNSLLIYDPSEGTENRNLLYMVTPCDRYFRVDG